MKKVLHKIPLALILTRLALAGIIILLAIARSENHAMIIFVLIILGFLTDFFDGYVARLLNVSTSFLRRFDTIADRIFWLSILAAAWILHAGFFEQKLVGILIVLSLEALTYLISFIRFRRAVATHAILAKIWAISLLLAFCELILTGHSPFLFDTAIALGIVSRIDTGLIMLILPSWNHDIPTFYHAILLRQGKEIKRHRFFNG